MKSPIRDMGPAAMAGLLLIPLLGWTDEPKVEVRRVIQVQVAPAAVLIEADVLDFAVPVAAPAKKPQQQVKIEPLRKPKGAAVAIEIEPFALPFDEALKDDFDLTAVEQNNPQVQQWIPHFTQQYRPILVAELKFIKNRCDLPKEKRPKIKAAGEAALKETALRMAELQAPMQGIRETPADPRRQIRDALKKALKDALTAEQMMKFEADTADRAALRKRAAILNVVARLDPILCLNAEQRDKITKEIDAAWQERWEQWLTLSIYGDQYFPDVPQNLITNHLNEEQKNVWNGLQRVDFGFWHPGGEDLQDEEWWGGAPANRAVPAPRAGGIGFF